MHEISVTHLISMLINDFENVHDKTRFEVKKINNSFIFTNVNHMMLDTIKLKREDIIGKTCSEFPIKRDLADKLPAIYDKAWNGHEMLQFLFPITNENVCLVVAIRPILKNGKTDRLIGCCVPINVKQLGNYFLPHFDQ
ncbi:hypothetical protein MLOOGBEN_18260 [Bacillus sp. EB106-08-02-XG196]|jgi:hypothetical protein|uniref:hypothetical protein n=1 Tax=Bacillus sp. EB106-08-02-XG196 TaxID=2737049 RepID=UPI0015C49795|nr:hypothetical protein [Bacillus sp. EB106-08-02-XG196]NWQ42648.1 hypothetical protein [Bacillus sp. EB106-08-02-XG196]